jgi:hypothetical protein
MRMRLPTIGRFNRNFAGGLGGAAATFLLFGCATAPPAGPVIARVNPASVAAAPATWDGREVEMVGLVVWESGSFGLYQDYGSYCAVARGIEGRQPPARDRTWGVPQPFGRQATGRKLTGIGSGAGSGTTGAGSRRQVAVQTSAPMPQSPVGKAEPCTTGSLDRDANEPFL